VVVAVTANLLIAVAKGVAALLTGSAAMLAETTHSIADTFNEVLLYVGVRSGARPADERHPFAYGKAGYTWSLLAAVGIFVVGGCSPSPSASRLFAARSR
jgi:divalent metal cation (Fe/Co/Zn/Cd) transporter